MNNYEKNLEALSRQSEKFVQWLSEEKPVDWAYKIKADNGDFNAVIKYGINTNTIYDNKGPRQQARKIVNGRKFQRDEVTILVGAGVGHTAKMICDKLEKGHILIIVEPVAAFIKMMLETYNLSAWIEKGQLLIAVTKDDFWVCCNAISSNMVVQNWSLIVEDYASKRPFEYSRFIEFVVNHITQIQCNMGTVMGAGKKIATNDIETLPYIIKHRGVKDLKDLYKGKPAVTIGTGPSLQNNIHLLQEHQDKVIIIAVAQALRILLAYDIRPDFICTVDYGDVNMGHFKGLMNSDIPLVALNRTYAPILKQYQGPMYIVGTPLPGFEDSGLNLIAEKGHLEQGGSVAHLCLGLAMHLGCEPITLIGHDLSLGKTSHFKAADESGDVFVDNKGLIQWKITDPHSHLYGKIYSMGPAIWTDGYFGGKVLTNQGLRSFITNFERIIQQNPDKEIYNSTEGGARVRGTKNISLSSFIENYAPESFDKDKPLKNKKDYEPNYCKKIKKAIPLLKKDQGILINLREHSKKGIELLDKFTETEGEEEIKKLLDEQQIWSTKAENEAKKNPLVQVYIYNESVKIQSRELKVKGAPDHLLKNRTDLETRIERSRLILSSARDAAVELLKHYENAVEIMESYIKTKDETVLTSEPPEYFPDFLNADEQLAAGSWARVLLDARAALEEDPDNTKAFYFLILANENRKEAIRKAEELESTQPLIEYSYLIEEAQRVGRDEKDFDAASEMLLKAIELQPDRPEAIWGYATTCAHMNKNEESLKYFKQLVEKWPDNNQFAFEHILVVLREDTRRGLAMMGELMNRTEEFDSFLLSLGDLYMSVSDFEKAEIAYNGYIEKFPTNASGWEKLSLCLQKQQRVQEANMAKKKAERLSPV